MRGRTVMLVFAFVLLLPEVVSACPVCFDSSDENRQAFLLTTAFLSLLPLGMVSAAGLWIRRRLRDDQSDESCATDAGTLESDS